MKKKLSLYIDEIKNVSSKGLFHLFTTNGLIYLVSFASQLFVAGMLDPIDIGRIKIIQTFIGLTSIGVGLGFNTSMIKRISGVDNQHEKARILQFTLLISLVSFLFFYILLFALNHFTLISSDKVIIEVLPMYALILLPLGIQSMLIAFYQANKEIKKMAKLQLFGKIITVGLIIGLTYFYGFKGYVIAIPFTGVIMVIILIISLKKNYRKTVFSKTVFSKNDFKDLWILAKFVLIANVIGQLNVTLDIYVVNYMITDRELVGFYMFAVTLVGVMKILPNTIQQIAFPYFSDKSANKDSWFQSYKKYNKLNHVFLILISLIAIILVPLFVKFVFQGKYNASLPYYNLLLIAWLIPSLNYMKGTALMGVGRFDLNMYTSLISIVFTLILLLLFGYFYQLNGIIAAKFIAGFISYFISFVIFKKYTTKTFNEKLT